MKTVLMTICAGLISFACAFGASWWIQQGAALSKLRQSEPSQSDPLSPPSVQTHASQPAQEVLSAEAPLTTQATGARGASVEDLVRLGLSLNEREKQLQQLEEQLRKRELRQKLALADLTAERQAIEGSRAAFSGQLDLAEKLLSEAEKARQETLLAQEELSREKQALARQQQSPDSVRDANTRRLAQWLQGMDPVKAAELLREMTHDGQTDTAVQILSHFEEREAARLLSAIEDPALLNELILRFREQKPVRPPQTPR